MEGGKVSLNREQLWVDMWEFEGRSCSVLLARRRMASKGSAVSDSSIKGHFLKHETEKLWVLKARPGVCVIVCCAPIRDAGRVNANALAPVGRMLRTCIDPGSSSTRSTRVCIGA